MFRRKVISLLLALAIVLPMGTTLNVSANSDIKIERIAGENRYQTSIAVSKAGFEQSEYAVIASGENFPDALVGGVLAGYLKAPLLITPKNQVSKSILDELNRLGVQKIYLLGGNSALSSEIENALNKYEITRLAGENRYETAKKVEAEIKKIQEFIMYDFYVDGRNFPDALSAAPFVYNANGIMHLNDGSRVDDGIAIGGENSVPGDAFRFSGNNRYETAVKLAKQAKGFFGIVIVNGKNFPDALSASGIAAKDDMVIILTESDKMPESTREFMKSYKVDNIIVLGGENSVSEDILNEIKNMYN